MKKKVKVIEKNNSTASPAVILMAAVIAVSFLFLYEKPEAKETSAAPVVPDPTSGWYLYQTKTNNLFQIKYPYTWQVISSGGFAGEENLYVQSPDQKTTLKILGRTGDQYSDWDAFLENLDKANAQNHGLTLLKEEYIDVDSQTALRREEYLAGEKASSIVTYIFKGKTIVQLETDFIGSPVLTPENKSFHSLVADTLKFIQ